MLATLIPKAFPELNDFQREAVSHTDGALRIIAGPGSGKTKVLIVRTLNILLCRLADPSEILLCTFTEKAAFELRDRLSLAAKKMGYDGDLSQLSVGTIHGICNDFLMRYRPQTSPRLGHNYEVLDELTQLLFIFDHFDELVEPDRTGNYVGRWKTRWGAIEGIRDYINKMTEECISPEELSKSSDHFLKAIGQIYEKYVELLFKTNRIDFGHQQKLFLQLLEDPKVGPLIQRRVRYIMVDEYQDTNYVQEQLLLKLSELGGNICVVGDEDQAMYRFRGATVRNILEFPQHFKSCRTIPLTLNYRSHKSIVESYDRFMSACDWSNPRGALPFRYPKKIVPNPKKTFPRYPAVFAIWGENRRDEAKRFADLVVFLKENNIIEDESQVALLLHSVRRDHDERYNHSGPFIDALEDRGIDSFCPRAKAYFDNEEIRLVVGCFAVLLGYYGDARGQIAGKSLEKLNAYVDKCITDLGRKCAKPESAPLAKILQIFTVEIESLEAGQTLNKRLSDYFYKCITREPLNSFVRDEGQARNLAAFSQLLSVFQSYYHYHVITARNLVALRLHFFNSFLRLLLDGGINEYEDPDAPFPKGHVQVLTIHQSKGLEFPVVVVGSLASGRRSGRWGKGVDEDLSLYFHREPFEPKKRISEFDQMRLHYVAFSRAENILVLTTTEQPNSYFDPIWQNLPQWPHLRNDQLALQSSPLRTQAALKKTYSFTNDLNVYETCPRQYEFYRLYGFTPARSAQFLFGSLVHQTIEDIHQEILDERGRTIDESRIKEFFDFNYQHLLNRGMRALAQSQRTAAFAQVINYFRQNREEMKKIIDTEVDVSVEKNDYILTGKIDLLMGDDHKLELLDFKSQPRPQADDRRLDNYYKQLCTYAHILEQRYDKSPERLLLYWTGEAKKDDALMIFPYKPELVREAGDHFDKVVSQIAAKDFEVKKLPEDKVCADCDFTDHCHQCETT